MKLINPKYFVSANSEIFGTSKKTFRQALSSAMSWSKTLGESVDIIKTQGKANTWKIRKIATIKNS